MDINDDLRAIEQALEALEPRLAHRPQWPDDRTPPEPMAHRLIRGDIQQAVASLHFARSTVNRALDAATEGAPS